MSREPGGQHFVAAIVGAMVSFCLAAIGIYYKVADVRGNGSFHGGPESLTAAMAGLFGGGIVAVIVLVFLLRLRNGRDRRELEP